MNTSGAAAAAPILSLAEVEAYDPQHPRKDGETRACCPLCGDEKPIDAAHRSLSYNRLSGLWHCHRCQAKGQFKEFWKAAPAAEEDGQAKDRGYSRRRDTAAARQAFRRRMSVSSPSLPASAAVEPPPDTSWLKHLGKLRPLAGTPGEAYLRDRRGGLPADFCHEAGVRFAPSFYGRPAIVFPVRDNAGQLVAAQGRYIDGRDTPRMRTAGHRRLGVFATPGALDDPGRIIVTEAPIDALTLAFVGAPTLALCGCEGFPDWLKRRCAFKEVIAAFDADEAGDRAALELSRRLAIVGAKVLRLRPAEGAAKDWNAILAGQGKEKLREQAAPVIPTDLSGITDPFAEDEEAAT